MPTYKYEAMDTSGGEVRDSVEAMSEEEAQQKIKQMGYFVTKITEVAGSKKGGKEKAQSLKRRITGAMIYPVVVILVAVSILSFIMIFIIPKFEKIFKDFRMELPTLTLMLMATSKWFVNYWYVLPLFPLCFWLLLK